MLHDCNADQDATAQQSAQAADVLSGPCNGSLLQYPDTWQDGHSATGRLHTALNRGIITSSQS